MIVWSKTNNFQSNFLAQSLEYNVALSSAVFPADRYESVAGVLYEIEPDEWELLDNLVW